MDAITLKPGDRIRVKTEQGSVIELSHDFEGIKIVNLSENGCLYGKRGECNNIIASDAQPKGFWI